MSIDQYTIKALAKLYDARERLQHVKETANKNFWIGVVDDAFKGTGTRSNLREAVGGVGELAILLQRTVSDHLEQQMRDLDTQIEELGGTP